MGKEDGRQNNPDLKQGEKGREGERQRVRMLGRRFSGKTVHYKHASLKKTHHQNETDTPQKPSHNFHVLRTQHFPLTFKTRQPILPLKKITAFQNLGKVSYSSARKGTEIKISISINSLHKVLL